MILWIKIMKYSNKGILYNLLTIKKRILLACFSFTGFSNVLIALLILAA